MTNSKGNATATVRWAVDLPVQVAGTRVRVSGNHPSWLSMIYFGGVAGITRAALGLSESSNLIIIVTAYALCVLLAPILGRAIGTKGERISRICSGNLGLIGF